MRRCQQVMGFRRVPRTPTSTEMWQEVTRLEPIFSTGTSTAVFSRRLIRASSLMRQRRGSTRRDKTRLEPRGGLCCAIGTGLLMARRWGRARSTMGGAACASTGLKWITSGRATPCLCQASPRLATARPERGWRHRRSRIRQVQVPRRTSCSTRQACAGRTRARQVYDRATGRRMK